MDEPYLPASDFLRMVADSEVTLIGSELADRNLRMLIAFTSDEDVSNRDWATMLLASQDIDTIDVRNALIAATDDADVSVRAEALEGLAARDKDVALPLVCRELQRNECGYGAFQAARILGDPSLLDLLRIWAGKGGASWIDNVIDQAIVTCDASTAED